MVADNYEDLVKCGYIEMKLPRKHRKFGRQVWKRKWFILRRKSWQGNPRLEYHKSEEACLNVQSKTVVDLKSLMKIEICKSKTREVSFKLVFSDTFMILSTENENNMKEWEKLIKKLVLPDPIITQYLPTEEGSFLVTVINTVDSERLKLAGDYFLSITLEQLSLYTTDRRVRYALPVVTWHLDDIPRFRLQKLNQLNDAEKIFIINLARTSQTAESEFQFLTQNGREILETVKSNTKQRSKHNDESPRSSPLGDEADVAASSSSFGLDESRSRSCSAQSHMSQPRSESSLTIVGEHIENVGHVETVGIEENSEHVETVGYVDNAGHIETVGYVDNAGHIETAGNIKDIGNIEDTGNIENVGHLDNAKRVENAGHVENSGHLLTVEHEPIEEDESVNEPLLQ